MSADAAQRGIPQSYIQGPAPPQPEQAAGPQYHHPAMQGLPQVRGFTFPRGSL